MIPGARFGGSRGGGYRSVGIGCAFGDEVDAPGLHRCALVATHYGQDEDAPLGVLGVIGPSRMDYARVISLVDFLSRVVTDKLIA